MVIKPKQSPAMQPYIDAFDLLRIILDILTRGDIKIIDVFEKAAVAHNILDIQLYEYCLKPKLHPNLHTAK